MGSGQQQERLGHLLGGDGVILSDSSHEKSPMVSFPPSVETDELRISMVWHVSGSDLFPGSQTFDLSSPSPLAPRMSPAPKLTHHHAWKQRFRLQQNF